ncbi:Gfo/Idh/MocA family protein [Paenibacillus silviterrae]|uniref:Gfo/Idh/MocA family protein n=1 Tax=Paenibacillus silviterrae TaxID=3242194 RepID=UPI0025430351|nr:Gfo/Idh/MocA family oxidoreductase [Paenibacillus chinjuensis]
MIRLAVIGTNWITEEFVKAAEETGRFELTAVYSRTEDKARDFAEKHRAQHLYSDIDGFVRSEHFDAVYIASPNSLHAEHAIACMKQGKHVLCEKPIASNADELKAMIAAAQQNGVLLMEAMKSTLMPGFGAICEHLPKLGRIRRYFASYCQYSSRYDAYKEGNVLNAFNPVFSNGSLMDLGIYCLYPLAVLFGKPETVKASGLLLESGVDGEGSLLLEYKDMDAVIMHSKISHSYLPAEIQGENGTMVIDRINQPNKVEIRYRDGRAEELTVPVEHHSMYYEALEFARLIGEGRTESQVNSHTSSLITMEMMDEARRQMGLVFPADAR